VTSAESLTTFRQRLNFHSKMSVCRHELGGGFNPQPPDNSNPAYQPNNLPAPLGREQDRGKREAGVAIHRITALAIMRYTTNLRFTD